MEFLAIEPLVPHQPFLNESSVAHSSGLDLQKCNQVSEACARPLPSCWFSTSPPSNGLRPVLCTSNSRMLAFVGFAGDLIRYADQNICFNERTFSRIHEVVFSKLGASLFYVSNKWPIQAGITQRTSHDVFL